MMTSRARKVGVASNPGGKPGRRRTLTLCNRQHLRPVDLRLLRRIVQALLRDTCPDYPLDLAVSVVPAPDMTRLNETFLHHKGSTDVITFDYSDRTDQPPALAALPDSSAARRTRSDSSPAMLQGEIFVCIDEAVRQSRHFGTTWQSELVRYVVHGLLHLLGHDDHESGARRRMKKTEDALLRQLSRRFALRKLRLSPKLAA
jgi:probable rRNA maturation factor